MYRAIVVSVAVGVAGLSCPVKAQDSDPLPQHKILAMEEGVWDAETTVTIPGQGAAKGKGVETNRLLAGKWLISDVKSEFSGMPFEGHGVYGYDAKTGKYVATWVDTMSVRMDKFEGSYDEKTKTLTFSGDAEEPHSGKPMKMRLEMVFKDDDTRVLTEFVQMEGEKDFVKFMEIKYTKHKK